MKNLLKLFIFISAFSAVLMIPTTRVISEEPDPCCSNCCRTNPLDLECYVWVTYNNPYCLHVDPQPIGGHCRECVIVTPND